MKRSLSLLTVVAALTFALSGCTVKICVPGFGGCKKPCCKRPFCDKPCSKKGGCDKAGCKKGGCDKGGCKKSGCGKAGCTKPCKEQAKSWTPYGKPMKLADSDTICAGKVMADAGKYDGKFVRLCGKVQEVCARKGCWITLTGPEGGESLRVEFTCPVEDRLIPMEAVGHRAIVEGALEIGEISEETARHYAEESKASPEEIAKIVGPQKQLVLKSPAALIGDL